MWRLLRKIIGSETAEEDPIAMPVRKSASLSPTSDGAALAADGRADIGEDGAWQRFLVEVTANVADGTVLTLIVNGRPVAPIVISRSAGDFEIAASEGELLPNGLHDVGQIETLAIATKEGVLLLTGAFAREDRSRLRRSLRAARAR
jgi:hypothetical protein